METVSKNVISRLQQLSEELAAQARIGIYEALEVGMGDNKSIPLLIQLDPAVSATIEQIQLNFQSIIRTKLLPDVRRVAAEYTALATQQALSENAEYNKSQLLSSLLDESLHPSPVGNGAFSSSQPRFSGIPIVNGNTMSSRLSMFDDTRDYHSLPSELQNQIHSLSISPTSSPWDLGSTPSSLPLLMSGFSPLNVPPSVQQAFSQFNSVFRPVARASSAGAVGSAPAPASDISLAVLNQPVAHNFHKLNDTVQHRIRTVVMNNPIVEVKHFDSRVVDKLLAMMSTYGETDVMAFLEVVEDRLRSKDKRMMTNAAGYLDTAVAQHMKELETRNSGTTPQQSAMLTLPADIYNELSDVLRSNKWLRWDHFDQGIIGLLRKLPREQVLERLQGLRHHMFRDEASVKGTIVNMLTNNDSRKLRT